MVEERVNYDGSQFLADIGGSLGFLLGLSVLGFIGIVEKVNSDRERRGNLRRSNLIVWAFTDCHALRERQHMEEQEQ